MKNPDETLYELEVGFCDDGDILLSQGFDGGGDEIMVRLHRTQLVLIAEHGGFVAEAEVARICERFTDRLNLLAAMVEAHTRQADPLRAAVAAIVPDAPRHITATTAPRLTPENAPRVETLDLFSEIAGGKEKAVPGHTAAGSETATPFTSGTGRADPGASRSAGIG